MNYFNSAARQEDLLIEALSWVGTPFVHRGRAKGGGVDCVGLVGEIMVASGVLDSYDFGRYPLDWSVKSEESLIEKWLGGRTEFEKVSVGLFKRGDIVLFKFGRCANHCGLVLNDWDFLHAKLPHEVQVSPLDDAHWKKRLAAVYRAL